MGISPPMADGTHWAGHNASLEGVVGKIVRGDTWLVEHIVKVEED